MTDIVKSFPWLQSSWSQLDNYRNQNRIPQALLITGHKGLGKLQLAEHYANVLLCSSSQADEAYCGECASCLLFKAETHPDYILIEPEEAGKAIGIAVIRQLIVKLALMPQYEAYRVVIINSADSLNNASANAFLKYLEEPTERTCVVLISEQPSRLPATIRSRCQKLNISTPDQIVFNSGLKQLGISDNKDLLFVLSQGAPLLAKQFADTSVLKLRTDCFKNWLKLAHSEICFVDLAEQWHKLARAETGFLLFWLISWIVDMIKLSYHKQPVQLYNQDLITDLQDLVQRLDLKNLYQYYDFLLLCQRRLDTQLNKQLMFEEILIQWSRLNSR
jgi:DNA polymerase-3 subunit delta'